VTLCGHLEKKRLWESFHFQTWRLHYPQCNLTDTSLLRDSLCFNDAVGYNLHLALLEPKMLRLPYVSAQLISRCNSRCLHSSWRRVSVPRTLWLQEVRLPIEPYLCVRTWFLQELCSREEELTQATLQQKSQEELLKRREQQLAEREINVLERELNILIFQLNKDKPNVKKRKGKFKRSRLKLKDGNRISLPSGERTHWENRRIRPSKPFWF